MSNEYVTVRNKVTRKVGLVRRRIAEHDYFGRNLEIVPEGTKPFVPLEELVGGVPSETDLVEDLNSEEDYDYKEEA